VKLHLWLDVIPGAKQDYDKPPHCVYQLSLVA